MDFVLVFKFLIEALKRDKIDFALIGGLALQSAGITRTTRDIDLLILSESTAKIKDILLKSGYELIHESEDVLNFTGKKPELGRVDFLLAHRKYTLAMLKRAEEQPALEGRFKIKVLKAEDLAGLKIQASSNDPERLPQDTADIKSLIKNNYSALDMNLVREYFRLFDREKELDEIIEGIENAKQ
ncbi:MAG: nucleotidyltransferase [Candidatus Omnitrophica bacterium]|nr:nucleotidyltransferase [Candidatus Omnitrophota bacterium]